MLGQMLGMSIGKVAGAIGSNKFTHDSEDVFECSGEAWTVLRVRGVREGGTGQFRCEAGLRDSRKVFARTTVVR